ncbi:hypothetical protein D3C85_1112800 [compost metagenome]
MGVVIGLFRVKRVGDRLPACQQGDQEIVWREEFFRPGETVRIIFLKPEHPSHLAILRGRVAVTLGQFAEQRVGVDPLALIGGPPIRDHDDAPGRFDGFVGRHQAASRAGNGYVANARADIGVVHRRASNLEKFFAPFSSVLLYPVAGEPRVHSLRGGRHPPSVGVENDGPYALKAKIENKNHLSLRSENEPNRVMW